MKVQQLLAESPCSIPPSDVLNRFIERAQFIHRACSIAQSAAPSRQLSAAKKQISMRTKKVFAFLFSIFLRSPTLFPVFAVFGRQDRCQFPCPRLPIPPIHIVLYLPHRQSHLPCQILRPHPCIPLPDHRPVRRLAESPSRRFMFIPFLFHPFW